MNERVKIKASQLAHILGVHPNTVKRIPPEKLPYLRIGNRGDRRYSYEDVKRYIEENTVNGK